jgi:hypothetical protein
MDLEEEDVRAVVQRHTRLTDGDVAELLAASMAQPGLHQLHLAERTNTLQGKLRNFLEAAHAQCAAELAAHGP